MPPPPWRKLALGGLVVLAIGGGVAALVIPAIEQGKEERAEEERRRDAAFEAAKQRRIARETRPKSGRGERPTEPLSPAEERRARRVLVHDLERAITRDARARVRTGELEGPILATECKINPPSRRPLERDLSVQQLDYQCLAVKARDPEGRFLVGHSFEATVFYGRYRFTWAKACYPPGEGSARPTC